MQTKTFILPILLCCACVASRSFAETQNVSHLKAQIQTLKKRAKAAQQQVASKATDKIGQRGKRAAIAVAVGEYVGFIVGPNSTEAFWKATISASGQVAGVGLFSAQKAYDDITGTVDESGNIQISDALFGFTISGVIDQSNGGVIFSGSGNDSSGASFTMSLVKIDKPLPIKEVTGSYSGTYQGGTSAAPNSASGTLVFSVLGDLKGSGTVTPTNGSGSGALSLGLESGVVWVVTNLEQKFIIFKESKISFTASYDVATTSESGDGSFSKSGGIPDQPAVNPFTASFTMSTNEGFTPLAIAFDASASTDPNGKTITAYNWDFGDGTTTTTTGPTTSHTYTVEGGLAATLTVTNSDGDVSSPDLQAIVIANGATGDGDLFASKANVAVNFAKHIKATDTDAFKITGKINPAGLPDDLSGALISFIVNGVRVGSPTPIGGSRSGSRATSNFIPILKPDGGYSLAVKNMDFREVLNIKNVTGQQVVRTKVEIEITGVSIDTPKITGVVRTAFNVKKNAAAKGAYSHITLGSPTGTFKSLRTSATEGKIGGHKVVASGPIEAEFSEPIIPNGDITVLIGGTESGSTNNTLIIPESSLITKGTGNKTVVTYSKKIQEIDGLIKFQINNAKKKFALVTDELSSLGIPSAGASQNTYKLLISISVPTSGGVIILKTTVQIKRKSSSSRSWRG